MVVNEKRDDDEILMARLCGDSLVILLGLILLEDLALVDPDLMPRSP